MQVDVTIKGVSPLLMNRFPETYADGDTRPIATGEKGTPREQAALTAYKDSKGKLYIPGPNLFAALVDAGKFHKSGKSKLTTQRASLIPAGLGINELTLSLGTSKFEVDSRRIVNPGTGGAHIKHRARLDNWQCSFTLDIDSEMFTEALIRKIVDDAGKKIGVLDYRPTRRGPFGKFVVTKWKSKK